MFEEFNERDKEQALLKLTHWKECISLESFHRVYLSNAFGYPMKRFDERNREAEERTLSYLLPLLKKGKLKVRRQILEIIPLTPEEIARNTVEHYKVTEYKEYETAEGAIEDIRTVWNSNSYSNFENTVEFTLPENEWSCV